jgi:hypothetical protein
VKAALPGSPAAVNPQNAGLARFMIGALIVVLVLSLVRGLFGHHETQEERVALAVTIALQQNDEAGVAKWQNAETATQVTHTVVGRAADAFAPLGKLETVRETSVDAATRVHHFDATFDKGVVTETIKFDPDGKIVGFKYDLPAPK